MRVRRAIGYARAAFLFRRHGVSYRGRPVLIGPSLKVDARGEIMIGSGFMARGRQFRSQLGCAPDGRLVLADNVFLNQGCFIFAATLVEVGPGARLGDMVTIYDTDFHQVSPDRERHVAPVSIGRNVWIGRGATILPGVTIGDHAVVAAGSVVTRSVEPMTVVAGNPATLVRSFDCPPDWIRE